MFVSVSVELKTQLLDWFERNRSVHVVMISNRFDQSDLDLLSKAHLRDVANLAAAGRGGKGKSDGYVSSSLPTGTCSHSPVTTALYRHSDFESFPASKQIVVAGGSVTKILMRMVLPILQQSDVSENRDTQAWLRSRVPRSMEDAYGDTLLFAHMWTVATYSLFGAGMLSLRHAYGGSAVMWPLHASSQGGVQRANGLSRHLLNMDSSIGQWFSQAFVQAMLQYHEAIRGDILSLWRATYDAFQRGSPTTASTSDSVDSVNHDTVVQLADALDGGAAVYVLAVTANAAVAWFPHFAATSQGFVHGVGAGIPSCGCAPHVCGVHRAHAARGAAVGGPRPRTAAEQGALPRAAPCLGGSHERRRPVRGVLWRVVACSVPAALLTRA